MLTRTARFLVLSLTLVVVACQQGPSSAAPASHSAAPKTAVQADGVLVGGIFPCPPDDYLALSKYKSPGYVAGRVVVLKGRVSYEPVGAGGGSVPVFPTETVTSASIRTGDLYRFELPPGEYALLAYGTWLMPYWANVNVSAGQTTIEDTPNPDSCI
ncbi:MAG TPA: hypothetical protein VND96_06935 [Candidatus Micrarchaeaceae archaeon]|nr:hypothetical protein [Candidatus Micrarchaeaceae archaeon]